MYLVALLVSVHEVVDHAVVLAARNPLQVLPRQGDARRYNLNNKQAKLNSYIWINDRHTYLAIQ